MGQKICYMLFPMRQVEQQMYDTELSQQQAESLFRNKCKQVHDIKAAMAGLLDEAGKVSPEHVPDFLVLTQKLKVTQAACSQHFSDFQKSTINALILERGLNLGQEEEKRKQLKRALRVVQRTADKVSDDAEISDVKAEAMDAIRETEDDAGSTDLLIKSFDDVDPDVLKEIQGVKFGSKKKAEEEEDEEEEEKEKAEEKRGVQVKERPFPVVPPVPYSNRVPGKESNTVPHVQTNRVMLINTN